MLGRSRILAKMYFPHTHKMSILQHTPRDHTAQRFSHCTWYPAMKAAPIGHIELQPFAVKVHRLKQVYKSMIHISANVRLKAREVKTTCWGSHTADISFPIPSAALCDLAHCFSFLNPCSIDCKMTQGQLSKLLHFIKGLFHIFIPWLLRGRYSIITCYSLPLDCKLLREQIPLFIPVSLATGTALITQWNFKGIVPMDYLKHANIISCCVNF